jgi:hypothetical protein
MNTNNITTTNNIDIDNEAERIMLSLRKNITNSHKSGLLREAGNIIDKAKEIKILE